MKLHYFVTYISTILVFVSKELKNFEVFDYVVKFTGLKAF